MIGTSVIKELIAGIYVEIGRNTKKLLLSHMFETTPSAILLGTEEGLDRFPRGL